MHKLIFILFSLLIFASLNGQVNVKCEINANSFISISGKSTVGGFVLKQKSEEFIKKSVKLSLKKIDNKILINQNEINIPVKKFTSDNLPALYDFRKLVKYQEFPFIKIKLHHLETSESNLKKSEIKTIAVVSIEITGISKIYSLNISSKSNGNKIVFDCNKNINIHDFDIDPPSNILGFISVNEWITISFHIELNYALID